MGLAAGNDAFGAGAGSGSGEGVAEAGISSLMRSTMEGSRLASALPFTSRPHFWIRSSNS